MFSVELDTTLFTNNFSNALTSLDIAETNRFNKQSRGIMYEVQNNERGLLVNNNTIVYSIRWLK